MSTSIKIAASDEAWDNRELGADAEFAIACPDDAEIDSALSLQAISIRLPKSLIEDFKVIANYNGVGYQPLMRDILQRFADSEKSILMREYVEQMGKGKDVAEPAPVMKSSERKCA